MREQTFDRGKARGVRTQKHLLAKMELCPLISNPKLVSGVPCWPLSLSQLFCSLLAWAP